MTRLIPFIIAAAVQRVRIRSWRAALIAIALATGLVAGKHAALAATEDVVEKVAVTPAKPQRPVSLRDRLVVGLQARLKSEVAFVERVVARVHSGHLPQRMVDETFFWSRQRAAKLRSGRSRRPIIYFQPAMMARAERLGVEL